MRLTLVNDQTGQKTGVLYPNEKSCLLDSLDNCQVPYGGGGYSHLAVSPQGVEPDHTQEALARVIEHPGHPPSIQELNYLGGQLQEMSEERRAAFVRALAQRPDADITAAINTVYAVLAKTETYDGLSMAGRAVLAEETEPLIRLQLVPSAIVGTDDPGAGIWIDCPAKKRTIKAAERAMGVSSLNDLTVNDVGGTLCLFYSDLVDADPCFILFTDIDRMAAALTAQGGMAQAAKFKAVLTATCCANYGEAASLAEHLAEYELYNTSQIYDRLKKAAPQEEPEDLVERLGFYDTPYGCVRKLGELTLDQQLQELDVGAPGPRLSM